MDERTGQNKLRTQKSRFDPGSIGIIRPGRGSGLSSSVDIELKDQDTRPDDV